VHSRIVVAAAAIAAAAAVGASAATASKSLLVGIYDEPQTLYGNPRATFPTLRQLHAQVLRVGLYWGGRYGVAQSRPEEASDPADPAYNWSLYDRTVDFASQYGIRVLFSIYGTPDWANGGAGLNHAPKHSSDLADFAFAAATRYSGTYPGPDGRPLPAVHLWLAWNEPNNPIFLTPQYKRVGKRFVVQSARDYADICKAVYTGVHDTKFGGERVACGATAPRGNNNPHSSRPSVSPIAFLVALKAAGLKSFDVYAHHPYYGGPSETPSSPPRGTGSGTRAITLGNIDKLLAVLTKLYGPKHLWITEYGYQTNPPDRIFGVSWAKQAAYLKQAYEIARKNPRIDMLLWYLLRDEPLLSGWQSGLETATGKIKPSFAAFASLRR
jgi:hypothetical protein